MSKSFKSAQSNQVLAVALTNRPNVQIKGGYFIRFLIFRGHYPFRFFIPVRIFIATLLLCAINFALGVDFVVTNICTQTLYYNISWFESGTSSGYHGLGYIAFPGHSSTIVHTPTPVAPNNFGWVGIFQDNPMQSISDSSYPASYPTVYDGLVGDCSRTNPPPVSPPNDNNDGVPSPLRKRDSSPCNGMPVWSVSEPYISLWLHDEPLGYQPAVGPRVSFELDFKQRESVTGYNPAVFNLGKKWDFSWFSYIGQDTNTNDVVYFSGGGSTTYYSTNDYLTGTILTGDSTNGFTVLYPDGGKDVYGFIQTNGSGVFQAAFLTQHYNAESQKITLNYYAYSPGAPVIRLQNIVDGDGRTNLIFYATTNAYSTNLISQISDAFGRQTYFSYDSIGHLTNITDVASNATAIRYDTNDWVTGMTTPYGTTTFSINETSNTNTTLDGRSILITNPDSSQELYLFKENAPGVASAYSSINAHTLPDVSPLFGRSFDVNNLGARNSFHWGARQYAALSTTNLAAFTANDFLKAHMCHWLLTAANSVGQTLSMEREPSMDNAGTIQGQTTWYDYFGKTNACMEGTQVEPLYVARALPDGTTAFEFTQRNTLGLVTTNISTYSANDGTVLLRTNIYVYAANQIDLVRATNALGVQVVSNYFNAYHQVLTNYNALNEKTVYLYKTNTQQLVSTTLPTGVIITNVYGAGNLLASSVVKGFSTNSFTYANDLILAQTDARGLKTTNSWDALNRLTGTAFPDGSSISNQYTILDLTATRDRLGNWTYFGYDSMRRNTTITNALGNVTTFAYCICGALESTLDAAGNLMSYFYDNQGNQTEVDYADGYSTMPTYNLLHQVVTVNDSSGASVTNLYNNQGLLVSSANAAGLLVTNQFDALDRLTDSVNVNGVSVGTTYDNLNRPLTRAWPDTGVERFGYTANYGGATSYTNPIGNVMLYKYDALNRKTNAVTVGVTTNSYGYSGPGDLLTITDGNKHATTFKYDGFGRMTNKVDAANNTLFVFKYDPAGRVTNRWSIAKGGTTYRYDALGNLTNIVYPVSPAISLAYDALNRLTNLVDATGATVYRYDAAGELLSEDGPWDSDTVSYSYTNRERAGLSLSQPGAAAWTQSYGYDGARRLTGITSPAGGFGYAYDAVRKAQVALLTLPGGACITNGFDSVARLTGTYLKGSGDTNIDFNTYTYNYAGQRTQTVWTAGNYVNYTYDNGGQLKTAAGKEAGGVTNRWQEQLAYGYDGAGNLTGRTNNQLAQTFRVNTLNEVTNITRSGTWTVAGLTTLPATNVTVNTSNAVLYADNSFAATNFTLINGVNPFTAVAKDNLGRIDTNVVAVNLPATNRYAYDLNGNLLTNGNLTLDYDDENQLIRVTATNAWKEEYVYDGKFRRRVEKDFTWSGSAWQQTNEVHFIYDGNNVIQERDTNNVPVVTYTRSGSSLLARTDNDLLNRGSLYAHAYYHRDGNGNVTYLLFANQTLAAKYAYDPFGNVLALSGVLANANHYRFAGKAWNERTGFYYFGRRYYDPNLQRFINRDPLAEQGGLNLYAYCGNDPICLLDMMGLCPPSLWDNFLSWLEQNAANSLLNNSFGGIWPQAEMAYGLFDKYGLSGYAQENGIWNASVMMLGEVAGTTPFAEGWYGTDIGYGSSLSPWQSVQRLAMGSVSMVSTVFAGYGMAGKFSVADTAQPTLTTVLGSKNDVEQYVGQPGFNTFTGKGVAIEADGTYKQNLDRANALFVNAAVVRGDTFLLVTDPVAHAELMQSIGKQSAYIDIEIEMLSHYEGVNVVPNHVTY